MVRRLFLMALLMGQIQTLAHGDRDGRTLLQSNNPHRPAWSTVSPDEVLGLLPVSVGDKVRVLRTHETALSGSGGLTGTVESMSVENRTGPAGESGEATIVIQTSGRDVQVYSDQVELIALRPGTRLELDGRTWISTEDGSWQEECSDTAQAAPYFIFP